MSLSQITDYWERCRPLVLSQYERATRLLCILEAGCNQSNDAEQAAFEVRDGSRLSDAEGVQLDTLGALFRESRLGRDDAAYRIAIQSRASLAVNGTPEEIMAFLRACFPTMSDVQYVPEYPAQYVVTTADVASGTGILGDVSPSGVQGLFGNPMLSGTGAPMLTGLGTPMYAVRN